MSYCDFGTFFTLHVLQTTFTSLCYLGHIVTQTMFILPYQLSNVDVNKY